MHPKTKAHRPVRRLNRWVAASWNLQKRAGAIPKFKICFAFWGIATRLRTTYSVELPDLYDHWTKPFRSFRKLSWASITNVHTDCWAGGYEDLLFVHVIGPLALIAVALLVSASLSGWRMYAHHGKRTSTWAWLHQPRDRSAGALLSMVASTVLRVQPFGLFILYVSLPSVSEAIFNSISCIGYYEDSEQKTIRYFLRADLLMECSTGDAYHVEAHNDHERLVSLMWTFVFVWPVGMVALCTLLLWWCRHAYWRGETTSLTHATYFITIDFQPHVYYWEPIDLTRRAILTGWVLLIEEEKHFLRLIVAVLLSLTYFVAIMRIQPYSRAEDNFLACGAQVALVCIFMGSGLIECFNFIVDQHPDKVTGNTAASAAMGISSRVNIVVVVILFTVGMLLLLIIAIVVNGMREYRQSIAKAKWACALDKETPLFVWERELTYACFLSHYKVEAASDCRFLHDVLSKMLQAPVYYDSSSLSDLRTLFTEGIQQSDCIVLLATKGGGTIAIRTYLAVSPSKRYLHPQSISHRTAHSDSSYASRDT